LGEDKRKSLGKKGEDRACEFLEANGFTILERNFRLASGEADIIAEKDNVIYFVEVKTRRETDGVEFYTKKQKDRLMNIAEAYLAKNNIDKEATISVLSIRGYPDGQCQIELVHDN
jgi:putative endonuclease